METCALNERIVESLSHSGSKHRTYVDGHIEQTECRVTLVRQFRVIIEIAHQHLQITLEQSCSYRNKSKADKHSPFVGINADHRN